MVKQRMRRGEPVLPAGTLTIRGDLLDPDVLGGVGAAELRLYGFYGVSVFA